MHMFDDDRVIILLACGKFDDVVTAQLLISVKMFDPCVYVRIHFANTIEKYEIHISEFQKT